MMTMMKVRDDDDSGGRWYYNDDCSGHDDDNYGIRIVIIVMLMMMQEDVVNPEIAHLSILSDAVDVLVEDAHISNQLIEELQCDLR